MRDSVMEKRFNRVQVGALLVGVVGLVALVILAFFGLEGFFQSYLYGYLFWLGLSLGSLVLLMVQHLAGGSWGATVRRPLEAGVMVLPLMALLFVPILFGIGFLYEWSHDAAVAASPILQSKTAYLNVPFFIGRAVFYFAVWLGLGFYFYRASQRQDEGRYPDIAYRLKSVAGPGIILYILTMTFAAIDWGMSLSPEWFSGIYGVILMIGQAISTVAFLILLVCWLARWEPFDSLLNEKRLQDLGNFLMAFTLFWAYVSFAQLIIQWSNNTVETADWYVIRLGEGWNLIALALLVLHFAAPFLILFSRWVKRKRRMLVWLAGWILLMRLVDLFWIIIPSFGRDGSVLILGDIATVVGIGGLWLAAFFWLFKRLPIVPLHDPRLTPEAIHAETLRGVQQHA